MNILEYNKPIQYTCEIYCELYLKYCRVRYWYTQTILTEWTNITGWMKTYEVKM